MGAALTTLNYSNKREHLNWLGYSSLLAAIPLIHFAISIAIWLTWWWGILRNPWLRPRTFAEFSSELTCFAPALCLFVLSLATYWLALKRRRIARSLLLVIFLSAVGFFWMDVHFQRYQVSVDIATKEYWTSGGFAHHYFTWWWSNDLWLRRH